MNTSSRVLLETPQSRMVMRDLACSMAAKILARETSWVGSSYRCVPPRLYVFLADGENEVTSRSARLGSSPEAIVIVNTCKR